MSFSKSNRRLRAIDALDGLEREREGIAEAEISLARRLRDKVRVSDAEQVERFFFDQVPLGIGAVEIHLVDLLEARLFALLDVAFDQRHAAFNQAFVVVGSGP